MGTADETFQTQLARAKNADGFLAALDQVGPRKAGGRSYSCRVIILSLRLLLLAKKFNFACTCILTLYSSSTT